MVGVSNGISEHLRAERNFVGAREILKASDLEQVRTHQVIEGKPSKNKIFQALSQNFMGTISRDSSWLRSEELPLFRQFRKQLACFIELTKLLAGKF